LGYLNSGGKPNEKKDQKTEAKAPETAGKPAEKAAAPAEKAPEKARTTNYEEARIKYQPLAKNFAEMVKAGNVTGVNDKSLQDLAEAFWCAENR